MDGERVKQWGRQAQDRARDMMDDASDRAGPLVERARKDARRYYDEAQDYAGSAMEDARRYASRAYDDAVEYVGDYAGPMRDRVQDAVVNRPFAALLVAGAVGFALSLLLTRR
jgi:ElaB/YqjD/DUF883 family membrane-anchored ribosome-binding protein